MSWKYSVCVPRMNGLLRPFHDGKRIGRQCRQIVFHGLSQVDFDFVLYWRRFCPFPTEVYSTFRPPNPILKAVLGPFIGDIAQRTICTGKSLSYHGLYAPQISEMSLSNISQSPHEARKCLYARKGPDVLRRPCHGRQRTETVPALLFCRD